MFVLITYDVNITSPSGARRLRAVAHVCQDYGHRVQNSVFECVVTEAQFVLLKNKIKTIINEDLDSVRFYNLGASWQKKVETYGQNMGIDVTGNLII